MNKNKIGMHVHELSSEAYAAIERLRPCYVNIMDPTPQWIKDIRSAAPDCYLGVRKYERGVYFADRDPIGWADEVAGMCGDAIDLVDGAITYNEPLRSGHDDPAEHQTFDAWQAMFITHLQDMYGMDALAFPFGTGQFTAAEDRVKISDAFPLSCGACRIIAPHDYSWPNMWDGEGWYCLRWLAWLSDMENASFGRKKVMVSECGLTQGVVGGDDIGWQTLDNNLMIAADLYLESLDWYNRKLVNIQDCLGCATFDWAGSRFGWQTFEHLIPYIMDGIENISAEPENGGEKMFPRVFNLAGEELFGEAAEDLVRYHGLTLQYPELQDGDQFFNLVKLEEREGPACFIFTVLKENGTAWVGMETAWGWAGMDEGSNDIEAPYATDWQERADIGFTNDGGNCGPGFGESGWWHDPYEPGPGYAWARHPSFRSVYLEGIGMEGGTWHRTMYATWQLETYSGEEPPPPEDDVSEQIIYHANEIINLASTGHVGGVSEVHLLYKSGETQIFVPKGVASLLSRLFKR